MMKLGIRVVVFYFSLLAIAICDDWPTWRADASRSGYTPESLPAELQLRWVRQAGHEPRPAWPRSDRMTFDRAFPIIAADGMLFYGDSVDCSVHALDAETGERVWTFPTRGPVRFAPAYWKGFLYATSDDGFLYCLDAKKGSLVWKKRGGPSDEMILGNGRMISRWPARGGALVLEDTLYFAAGIWPSDGVSLYALEPKTGDLIWMNDTAGSIYMGQPHGGAFAKSGVAAQGYLLADDDQIFMATGRAVPAAFDRKTGDFQYLSLQANTRRGGAEVVLSDKFFINSGYAFEKANGKLNVKLGAGPVVATPEGLLGAIGEKLAAYRWAHKKTFDRRGNQVEMPTLQEISSASLESNASTAIVAGKEVVLGSKDSVSLHTRTGGAVRWDAGVSGTPYGLVVADEQLFVSTDKGMLYCFGAKKKSIHDWKPERRDEPVVSAVADEIIQKGKVTTGYGLFLGCGDPLTAIALARKTDLFLYLIEPDPEAVAAARASFVEHGLHGSRIMILQGDPEKTNLPNYFANLVVADTTSAEARRVLRPWGGTLLTGEPGSMEKQIRGPLKGAGQWTHQYADPSNTVNSGDELVRGPLGMLWFSDLEQRMTQRHGRGPSPLFHNGVLYSEGLDSLIAVDAYNGTKLWEYHLPGILKAFDGDHLMGTSGTGSNYCVSDEGVFVRRGDHCLRIDRATGKLLATFHSPVQGAPWGYLACEDGVLVGTIADPGHVTTYRYRPGGDMSQQLTESKTIFALDAETGKLIWRYDAKHSIRNNAIAIGNRAVVLIDRAQASFDRIRKGEANKSEHPDGELIAFDLMTGHVLWKNSEEIYGTVAAISEEHHSVMMSYQPTRFRLASEVGGKVSVFDLSTGKHKWTREARYESRPVINSDTIYAQGAAWDMLTGEDRPFNFKRSYGCGILAGSRDLMVFRSATLGYFDLTKNQETEDYGGIRPGCWINAIPAGGLVFAPDGSAGCTCSYLNQSWIALQSHGLRAPRFEAASFSDPEEVVVEVVADTGSPTLRYTLDGSSPTLDAPIYEAPLRIRESTTIRARAFDEEGRPSPPVSQEVVIDPQLLPLTGNRWKAIGGEWEHDSGIIIQSSNFGSASKATLENTAGVERPGAIYLFDSPRDFTNGELSFEIHSEDNDALGFVIGYQNPDDYFLWSMSAERPYRALARKKAEAYSVLGEVKAGYTVKKWHSVRLVIRDKEITGYFDGVKDFSIKGETIEEGKIGFYSWANSGSHFRNLRFLAR